MRVILLTQIDSYAKKLFSSTAELGFMIVATTGNWESEGHTKLITLPTDESRFKSIPALTICFKHMNIKEYHVIMEANLWMSKPGQTDVDEIRKGEPVSALVIMSCDSDSLTVKAYDTMTMEPIKEFGDSFQSSWSSLLKCPPGAIEMLPKEAYPMMMDYWNHFKSIQV